MSSKPWADQPFSLTPTPGADKSTTSKHSCVWVANEMAHAHNSMLRALNSIYLQCTALTSETDISDLLIYCRMWKDWIHHHHEAEETLFFPAVEKLPGTPAGAMQSNVEQHHAFEPGLQRFEEYVRGCEEGNEKFSAEKLKAIVDSFGETLTDHLKDEIPTLLRLEGVDSKALREAYGLFDKELRKGEKDALYPIVMGCSDKSFEGGNTFPEAPFFVPYVIHYYFERKYKGSWRFNPCTAWSQPRLLVFLN